MWARGMQLPEEQDGGGGGGKRRRRRRTVYSGANAVIEEDPERDRATQEKEKGGEANEDQEQATFSEHFRKDFVAVQIRLYCISEKTLLHFR